MRKIIEKRFIVYIERYFSLILNKTLVTKMIDVLSAIIVSYISQSKWNKLHINEIVSCKTYFTYQPYISITALIKHGNVSCLQYYSKQKFYFTTINFYEACKYNNVNVLQFFKYLNLLFDLKGLEIAIENDNCTVIKYLIKNKVMYTKKILITCIHDKKLSIVKILLEHGKIDNKTLHDDCKYRTIIRSCCMHGDVLCMKILKHKFDLTCEDWFESCSWACAWGNLDILKYLISINITFDINDLKEEAKNNNQLHIEKYLKTYNTQN